MGMSGIGSEGYSPHSLVTVLWPFPFLLSFIFPPFLSLLYFLTHTLFLNRHPRDRISRKFLNPLALTLPAPKARSP